MKPQVVAWELGKRLDDDAVISCDSGTIAIWFARYIPVKKSPQHGDLTPNLARHGLGVDLRRDAISRYSVR